MNFYLDESSSFRVPDDPGTQAVGIVGGVVIPESQEPAVFRAFDSFLSGLPPTAFKEGEPKGRLLDDNSRAEFVNMLMDLPIGPLLCPIMLDLTSLAGRTEQNISSIVSSTLNDLQQVSKHESARQQLRDLSLTVGKMSNQQVLRLAAWARCIRRCINDSFIFHCGREFEADWSKVRFVIDPVQEKRGSEETAFNFLVRSWIGAWSHAEPLPTIEGIHTANHPVIQNWATPDGFDAGKMFAGNIDFIPSEKSKGIQIADMVASLVRRAVVGLAIPWHLENYGFMMTRTIGRPLHASGLFFLASPDRKDVERRYQGIADAINIARKVTPSSYALPS